MLETRRARDRLEGVIKIEIGRKKGVIKRERERERK